MILLHKSPNNKTSMIVRPPIETADCATIEQHPRRLLPILLN
jgi:hypothetical protein